MDYYWSLGYNNNEGFVVGDHFTSIRSRINLESEVTNWLSVGLNTQFANRDESAIVSNYHQHWRVPPYGEQYTDDGLSLRHSPTDNVGSSIFHPLYSMTHQTRSNIINSLISSLYTKVQLPLGINYQVNFSPRFHRVDYKNHQSSNHAEWSRIGGRSQRRNSNIYSWQLDNLFSWDRNISDRHRIVITGLINAEKYQSWSDNMTIQQFDPTDAMGYHFMGAGTAATASVSSSDAYETADALMGRIFYSYDNKYMTTISIRRDGYSAFGLENPRGIFPAVAFAWTFTEENIFMKINK